MRELPNGDLMLGGGSDNLLNHNQPAAIKLRLFKTDKDGNLKWARSIGNTNSLATSEYMRSLNPTQDGGFTIVSWLPYAANPKPYSLIKIDSTGCDTAEAYCKSIAAGIDNFKDLSGWELSVFPNPAREVINIKLDAPLDKNIVVEITDVAGRTIEQINVPTNQTQHVNTTAYAGGVYLLRFLYEGKVVETKRIVVTR